MAKRVCNRIAVIDSGCIVEEGATEDVFSNPQSDVTRELLGLGPRAAQIQEDTHDAEGGDR